jgi:hypothetical protein
VAAVSGTAAGYLYGDGAGHAPLSRIARATPAPTPTALRTRSNRDVWKDDVVSSIVGGSFVMWQQPIEVEIEDHAAAGGGARGGRASAASGSAGAAASGAKLLNNHAHDFLLRYRLLGADYGGGGGDGGGVLASTELPLVAIVDPRTNELVQVRADGKASQ